MDSWRVELVKGNSGELRALEPTLTELVTKRWRAELLEVALQNCACMRFSPRTTVNQVVMKLKRTEILDGVLLNCPGRAICPRTPILYSLHFELMSPCRRLLR